MTFKNIFIYVKSPLLVAIPNRPFNVDNGLAVHSPLNLVGSALWIAYMDTQLLGCSGNLTVWMSQISTEWRECSIMTLSTIYWVPVQDKGSKILCGKLGAMKITPSDCLHQEYLTINLGSTSNCRKLKLPLNLTDTTATSQFDSSLEFITASTGRQCYIQGASAEGCEWGSLDLI